LHGGLAWRGQLRQSMFHGRFPVNQLLGRREYAMPQRSKVNSKWHERNHSRDMSPVAKIVAALRYGLRPARAFSRLQRSKRMSCESMTKLQASHAFFLNDFTPRRLTRRVRERTASSHRRTCRRPAGGPHRNGAGRIRQFTERFAARRVPAPAPAMRARRTSQYRYRHSSEFLLIDRPIGIGPIFISALAHSDSRLTPHSSCHESKRRDLFVKRGTADADPRGGFRDASVAGHECVAQKAALPLGERVRI